MSLSIPLPGVAEPGLAAIPTNAIWRLSVERYHQMIQAGILVDGDPVELLEGLLVRKMTKSPPHTVATGLVLDTLGRVAPSGWFGRGQEPITLDDSEPEPDVALCRGKRRDYTDRHPGPAEVALVVELADSTRGFDRGAKKRIYARHRIAVYWIVNLLEDRLEVYTLPSGPSESPDSQQRQDYQRHQDVPVVIEGREAARVAVADLLP